MYNLLWLIPILPLTSFLLLVLLGYRQQRLEVGIIGVGLTGAAALLAILIGINFAVSPPPGHAFTQVLYSWIHAGTFNAVVGFRLDALSLLMTVVVTFVGFLILLYSTRYMADDDGYSRFFAYMNLFIAAMLILVLADNLLLLYLGWEGVGLCSYLLIGFWYRDIANGRAAMKAFIVTRIGDAAFTIGLILLFTQLGTLNIQALQGQAQAIWAPGSVLAIAAAALLLAGAVGKSAQLPLQVWLPDAMAGPTPTSALIHAATMVTAGVYLIARMHTLFQLAPPVMTVIAVIGAVTLLIASFSALTQWDLKRVLAYSTISQVGYMFLALGVGAWTAAMLHFFTHAFFKSLLFLAAGAVILSMHHEQNMAKMGGLRKALPVTFWTFLIGALSLSALPLVTAGFYSKDWIVTEAWVSGNPWLWAAAWLGAFLTALYTFRMVFLVFFGAQKQAPHPVMTATVGVPLVTLAVLSIVAGFVQTPATLGNIHLFSDFLDTALPAHVAKGPHSTEMTLQLLASLVTLAGIGLAYVLYLRRQPVADRLPETTTGRFWASGWGFDWLYNRLFVQPYIYLANVDRDDVIDRFFSGLAWLTARAHHALSRTQNGKVRWAAAGFAVGAVLLIAILVFR